MNITELNEHDQCLLRICIRDRINKLRESIEGDSCAAFQADCHVQIEQLLKLLDRFTW